MFFLCPYHHGPSISLPILQNKFCKTSENANIMRYTDSAYLENNMMVKYHYAYCCKQ